MKKNADKPFLFGKLSILYSILVLGIIFGCMFLIDGHEKTVLTEMCFESGREPVEIFVGVLFSFSVYLLLVFVFGLTFLGVLIIPIIVFLKGAVLGVTFTVLFVNSNTWGYIQKWFCFGPAAFSLMLLLVFALHAGKVSWELCRQLKTSFDAGRLIKKLSVHFVISFFLTAISGGIYSLSVLCGNLI